MVSAMPEFKTASARLAAICVSSAGGGHLFTGNDAQPATVKTGAEANWHPGSLISLKAGHTQPWFFNHVASAGCAPKPN